MHDLKALEGTRTGFADEHHGQWQTHDRQNLCVSADSEMHDTRDRSVPDVSSFLAGANSLIQPLSAQSFKVTLVTCKHYLAPIPDGSNEGIT